MKKCALLVVLLVICLTNATYATDCGYVNRRNCEADECAGHQVLGCEGCGFMCEKCKCGAAVNRSPASVSRNCYCNGQNWPEGSIACMGGYKMVCVSNGWANKKSGDDPIRCDGHEHCK